MLIRYKKGICCALFILHDMLIKQYNPLVKVKLLFCPCNGDTKGRCLIQTKITLRKLVFSKGAVINYWGGGRGGEGRYYFKG